ncbi:hypothetical protein [Streptomyces dysideae]|uniref:Ricin B lectin domain-containing protein n=1 Tax=Streptomyces dysideae TaxID=909626 RepID=A0A101UH48_9ACTN|nr:hypothetical protein [Streptomyces dysideae]KUO10617.1 hypothetical protein AQJ91_48160 [Streptomyces dysideae]
MATTGLLVLAMGNPASAATMEYNTASSDNSSVNSYYCAYAKNGAGWTLARGCFQPSGDIVFAKDNSADGWPVYTLWQNELKDSNGNWGLYRNGKCSWSGNAPSQGSCNKDMYEYSSKNAHGGVGSRVRVKSCVADLGDDTCSSWSTWILNA